MLQTSLRSAHMRAEVAAKLRRGTPMPPKRARRLCVAAWIAGLGWSPR